MMGLDALLGRGRYVIRRHQWGWHVMDMQARILPVVGNHLNPLKAWQQIKQLEGGK